MQHLSVAENVYMGQELITKAGTVNLRKQEMETQKLLDAFDLKIKAHEPLVNLTIAQQQMVEIIRAVLV